jgi:predicted nucleic acid-binding protein
MRYLLDTCVISEIYKIRPALSVTSWLDAQVDSDLYLSVITLGEMEKGIHKLPDSKKRTQLTAWVHEHVTQRFSGRILPITEVIAQAWGKLQGEAANKGRPLAVIDTFLAATSFVHGLTLVTRNAPDMEATGAPLFNPWNS